MRMRALAVCLLALSACSGDSTTKDLAAADLPAVHDGPGRELLVFPDGPGREAQAGDQSVDKRAPDVGVADHLKPDAGPAFCGTNKVLRCDCYGKSNKTGQFIKLWGKAQEVNSFPDFKVRVDTVFGKLNVKQVNVGVALKCGEWQTVTTFGDFTYQIVTIAEDFTIQYDQFFPGIDKAACPTCP